MLFPIYCVQRISGYYTAHKNPHLEDNAIKEQNSIIATALGTKNEIAAPALFTVKE